MLNFEKLIVDYQDQELKDTLMINFVYCFPTLFSSYSDKMNDEVRNALMVFDLIEIAYRHYLVGLYPNLRRVYYNIQWVAKSRLFRNEMLYMVLKSIEEEIVRNELYELMPRHLDAIRKIAKYLNSLPTKTE